MSIQNRRERERAQRHQLIITQARQLAETEGWDAVTTRRLAEQIEYSQPVLYSHFAGKNAIVAAVAIEGCVDFTAHIRAVRRPDDTPKQALASVARAYLDFAVANPALYDAMFIMATDLPFGEHAPDELKAAFGALYEVFALVADGAEAGTMTEVGWSALHGLVMLTRDARLPPAHAEERLAILIDRLAGKANQ